MRASLLVLAGLTAAIAAPLAGQPTYEDRRVERLSWPELQRFESEGAFRDYLRDVRRMQRQLRDRRVEADVPEIVVAQAEIECGTPELPCPEEDDGREMITVTGSRVASAAPSITNNQSAGVDEGDIVKRIGDYLLVLQDGRIFAINFRTMALTDRADVYRRDDRGEPMGADWYDEMLVQDDHILITAYSYWDDATELSVFHLDQATGRVEKRGVFLITSDDYYDVENYATRIVGDRLVIYTPYEPEMLASRRSIPVIRRWVSEEQYDDSEGSGERVLEARDIFKPVIGVEEPWVHTISVCPLGRIGDRGLTCDSTAFIAGESAEMFVSPESIFLFTTAGSSSDWWDLDECKDLLAATEDEQVVPGAVFRVALGYGEPTLLPVRGAPFNQFSMDERNGRFRMLANWNRHDCNTNGATREVRLIDERLATFSGTWRAPPSSRFAPVPSPGEGYLENRFIGDWLLYGTRARWGRPPDPEDEDAASAADGFAVAVPIATPQSATRVRLGHEITRLEAVGDDAVATGYRDNKGLNLTMIGLGASAEVSSSVFLPSRFESEGRSHAFNSIVGESGAGMLGVPTAYWTEDSSRYPWWSEDSDLSFLRFDAAGALTDLGTIEGRGEDEVETAETYACEVSCIDWYGNARPIFIEDRIFALMGTELVEARVEAGKVQPATRVDLTGPVTGH